MSKEATRLYSSSNPMMASRTLRSSRGSCCSAQARQASTSPSATGSAGAPTVHR